MFLKVYTQYVNHFNKAIATVARLKRISDDFRAFLMVSQKFTKSSQVVTIVLVIIVCPKQEAVQRTRAELVLDHASTANTEIRSIAYGTIILFMRQMFILFYIGFGGQHASGSPRSQISHVLFGENEGTRCAHQCPEDGLRKYIRCHLRARQARGQI